MAARTLAPLALALLALALHGCGKDEVRGDAEGQCGAESCSAPGDAPAKEEKRSDDSYKPLYAFCMSGRLQTQYSRRN